MIIAAALCPSPPLLVRELTGADPVVADLRDACAGAVHALLAARPDVIVVVGPGPDTTTWPTGSRLNIAAYGGRPAQPADARARAARPASNLAQSAGHAGRPVPARPGPAPLAIGLGGYLLDQAGYTGPRRLHSVSEDDQPADCLRLGKEIGGGAERTGLLVMADGSARRGPRAPGHFDERAEAFDAEVERALRAGDRQALEGIDPILARELMATGRPAWQVLAGATHGSALLADVMYAGDPLGVMYVVSGLRDPRIPGLSRRRR
jgi:hypothetical protein